MEWEAELIEQIQKGLGGIGSLFGKVFSFAGGEMGLLLVLVSRPAPKYGQKR